LTVSGCNDGVVTDGSAALRMTNSDVAGCVRDGVRIEAGAPGGTVNLGDGTTPGNNVMMSATSTGVGLNVLLPAGINARGNTWRPNVQGTNGAGRYSPPRIDSGPDPWVDGNNYALAAGASINL
jgi:hypothetical protein